MRPMLAVLWRAPRSPVHTQSYFHPFCVHFQKLGNDFSLRAPVNDAVNKPLFEQKLGALEAFGKFLTHGLFNNARPGKPNQRARLRKDDIRFHCEACDDAAGCWSVRTER